MVKDVHPDRRRPMVRRALVGLAALLGAIVISGDGRIASAQNDIVPIMDTSISVLHLGMRVARLADDERRDDISRIRDDLAAVLDEQERIIDWLDSAHIVLRDQIDEAFRNDIERELAAEIAEFQLIVASSLDFYSEQTLNEKINRMQLLLLRIVDNGPGTFTAVNAGLSAILTLHALADIDVLSTRNVATQIASRYGQWTTAEEFGLAARRLAALNYFATVEELSSAYQMIPIGVEVHLRNGYTRVDLIKLQISQSDDETYDVDVLFSEGASSYAPTDRLPDQYQLAGDDIFDIRLASDDGISLLRESFPSLDNLERQTSRRLDVIEQVEQQISSFLNAYYRDQAMIDAEMNGIINFVESISETAIYIRENI